MLIQIVFTEWRDASAASAELVAAGAAVDQAVAREAAARSNLALTDAQLAIAEVQQLKDQRAQQATELVSAMSGSKSARDAQEAAAAAVAKAMKQHAMVGKTGYQVVSDAFEVEKVVDADGNDLPDGAVYGYQVVNTKPAAPAWAAKLGVA